LFESKDGVWRTPISSSNGRSMMTMTRNLTMRAVVILVAAGLLAAASGTGALSNEGNCRRLEGLARQYAGVQLTSSQQQLKRRMVAWYSGNCMRMRRADAW
jgi:hypothetical protein